MGILTEVKVLVAQSCMTFCNPIGCMQPVRLLCPWDFPGKNTGVGCHFLLHRIFPTQGLNLGLLHCRWILYHLNHQGSPNLIGITLNLQISLDNMTILAILTLSIQEHGISLNHFQFPLSTSYSSQHRSLSLFGQVYS